MDIFSTTFLASPRPESFKKGAKEKEKESGGQINILGDIELMTAGPERRKKTRLIG